MIVATTALPVSGPEGAYSVRKSEKLGYAAAATVQAPSAAQPTPAATTAATMPPLGSNSSRCEELLMPCLLVRLILVVGLGHAEHDPQPQQRRRDERSEERRVGKECR